MLIQERNNNLMKLTLTLSLFYCLIFSAFYVNAATPDGTLVTNHRNLNNMHKHRDYRCG